MNEYRIGDVMSKYHYDKRSLKVGCVYEPPYEVCQLCRKAIAETYEEPVRRKKMFSLKELAKSAITDFNFDFDSLPWTMREEMKNMKTYRSSKISQLSDDDVFLGFHGQSCITYNSY